MKINEIIGIINEFAPIPLQESYDNAGLIIGDPQGEANSALLTIDITEEVIDEAIKNKDALIISHHPIIFSGLKKINGANYVERCIIKAIQNNIAIYAAHTNIDSVFDGVNNKICEKLNLKNVEILEPKENTLLKLVCFIPLDYKERVANAIFSVGAGKIGTYNSCSFNTPGTGTFMAGDGSHPFVGEKGHVHEEKEVRFETIIPSFLKEKVLNAMYESHPYEEVAYDIYPLKNSYKDAGIGMIGNLENEIDEKDFLDQIKNTFKVKCIRHTKLFNKKIKRVAVCGGSGSFLLKQAIRKKADIFISADFKYHQFFDAENKIIIADIGHYESEQFTTEIFYDVLTKKITNFAIHFSQVNTNPLNYY